MPRFDLLRRPQPFLGILLVSAGWALSHQIGSNSVLDDCTRRGGGFVVLVSLLGLAMAAGGGLDCLRSWRVAGGGGRGFLALVGMLLSLMAGFAIVLQCLAGLMLPSCAA
jgi:hypothetical protein